MMWVNANNTGVEPTSVGRGGGMTKPSYICYIDESGDEGFKFREGFRKGSSCWFVLSAVVLRTPDDSIIDETTRETKQLIAKAAKKDPVTWEEKRLRWKDLTHERKVFWASRLAELDITCMAVACGKMALSRPEKFAFEHRLYFYIVRLLLERVSWYVREKDGKHGNGKTDLVFSKNASLPYAMLDSYLKRLERDKQSGGHVEIDFNYIGRREAELSEKRAGLQATDAFAGAVHDALELSPLGITESRYLATFLPVVWKRRGSILSYGLKIFPPEAENGLAGSELLMVVKRPSPRP